MSEKDKNLLSSRRLEDEYEVDLSLRPSTLKEYVGQTALKENLEIFIKAKGNN